MTIDVADFFLAAYLVAEGYALVAITSAGERGQERFAFEEGPGLADRVAQYHADTARVNPKAFAQAIMKLRQHQRGRTQGA